MQVQTIVVLIILILVTILVWQLTRTPPTTTPTSECSVDSDCSSIQYCLDGSCKFDDRVGLWVQRGFNIDAEAAGDRAGESVSMSADGNIIAVGAPRNNGAGAGAGDTRVFVWDGITWTQRGADIDGEAAGDWSGEGVSLSADGSTVAISASRHDGGASESGHTRIFDWDGSTWTQRGLAIDGELANDWDKAIDLSPDGLTIVIGSINHGGTGHVRIFDWDGSAWTQRGLAIDGEANGDANGRSVSLSADKNTVAIGASGTNAATGSIRIFDWDGSAWIQRGVDIDGEAVDDSNGRSVSLSADGNTVAMGAPNNTAFAGAARIFDWDGSAWIQRGLSIVMETDDEGAGSVSLSVDGNTIAIGSIGSGGTYRGDTKVYVWDGSAWVQRGPTIDGVAIGDWCGYSVDTSSNGRSVVIGSIFNGSVGVNAGHVRVFDWVTV